MRSPEDSSTQKHLTQEPAGEVQGSAHEQSHTTGQQEAAEKAFKQQVTIYYWGTINKEPEILLIACATYPVFSLGNCPAAIQAVMSLTSDGLIETFVPKARGAKKWYTHSLATCRIVEQQETLLYRARGVSDGEGMSELVTGLLSNFGSGSVKRAYDAGLSDTGLSLYREVRQRTEDSKKTFAPNTQPGTSRTPPPVTHSRPRSPSTHDATSHPHPPPSSPTHDSKATPASPVGQVKTELIVIDLTLEDEDGEKEGLTVKNTGNATPKGSDNTTPEASDEEPDLDAMPMSIRTRWPLRYVKPMAKGFACMDKSKELTREARFKRAFPSIRFAKTTYRTYRALWEAATEEQKSRFIKAGYTEDGLWENFIKEVRGN